MNRIRAVIFDMDGVLIDSEIVYLNYQYEVLHRKYPWITRKSLFPLVGISGEEGKKYLAEVLKRNIEDPEFQQELRDLYLGCQVYYPDILRPQVQEVLVKLKNMGFQIALASSSSLENITTVLKQCEIREYFDVIVSGEQFERSKPDPEIYQYTMHKLSRKKEECLIIEDSTYGIQAANRAGVRVVALKDQRFGFDQSSADLLIEDFGKIPSIAMCGGELIKAAFFDIDGTLAEEKTHYIPESLYTALENLSSNGIRTFLSTGRHPLEVVQENLIADLEFDGGIYINGQLCEYHGDTISCVQISKQSLKALKDFLQQYSRSCIFFEENQMYTNLIDERIIEEQARIGTKVPEVKDIEHLEDRTILQVIPFITEEEEQVLMEAMPDCELFRWGKSVVDVNCRVCGKDAGMKAICKALAIRPEETICFGDAQNDLRIIEKAGIGVAMGSAPDYVKKVADYVTGTVREDGIYKALVHFGLICEKKKEGLCKQKRE
ncbi:MAG: Cof-type HAD-IIB family hydrolase [Lachnospiraceae bacterium]|nr:Cof-type HAD-IIB family hydrolase [Lachnospiraceae bacterium]